MVLEGKLTREEVASWAWKYVTDDSLDIHIQDKKLWDLLVYVSGIDIKDSPEEYLHDEDDVKDRIRQFEKR